MLKPSLVLVALAILTGCGLPHAEKQWPPRPGIGDREPPKAAPNIGDASALAQKVVSAKEEPATLIAADRSSCVVTEKKFRETALGTKAWCNWR